jgi:protein gp37
VTDATWNPVAGCTIVTAGCTNCYAMEMAKRHEAMGVGKCAGLTRRSGKRAVWRGVVHENRETLSIPYQWRSHAPRQTAALLSAAYAPDRNPDELIWKHLKADTVGRMAITEKLTSRKR